MASSNDLATSAGDAKSDPSGPLTIGTNTSEDSAELFEESLKPLDMQSGTVITGIVVDIDGDRVTVHAGLKSEGVIPVEQFCSGQGELTVKVGDEVHVALDTVEDGPGETKLSCEKAKRAESWTVLEATFVVNEVVRGVVNGKVEGGFTVGVNDIRAFLPGSLVNIHPIRDATHLEGKKLEFKVVKLDQKRDNAAVSRRSVLETGNSAERKALLESLQEGQRVKGIVKNLIDYGVLVNLGGVDDLLHTAGVAWERIKRPSETVNVGDETDVKVLKLDRERNRVPLDLKQLGKDPWITIKACYPEGARVIVRVTNLTSCGCLAKLEEGVKDLVHVSEMDQINKNIHLSKVIQVGDKIEVQVLDIDEERRRISLGIKQCKFNPWEGSSDQFNKGDRISGTTKSATGFGISIGPDDNTDGLAHLSDASWNEVDEGTVRHFKRGDELETVTPSVDPEREHIFSGIRQLEDDPFSNYASLHKKGSIVRGTVKEVDAKSAIIGLGDDIEGILKVSEIDRDRVRDVRNVLKGGGEVEAKIISIDCKGHAISLSVKSEDVDDKKGTMRELCKQEVESAGSATIGDLIRAQAKDQD